MIQSSEKGGGKEGVRVCVGCLVVMKALLEKMILEKQRAEGMSHVPGKGIPGREHSICKGPEVGLCLVFWLNREEVTIA